MENVLAGLVVRDGVGNDGIVRTLVVGDGVAKIELREMALDNTLSSPARRSVGQGGSNGAGESEEQLHAA